MLHLVNGDSTLAAWRQAGIPGEAACWDGLLVEDLSLAPDPALAARARDADEVVLWTEDDLHCAINALPLMETLEKHPRFAWAKGGPEERTGRMDASRLRALHEARAEVPIAARTLARRAWDAYRAPDPRGIEALLREADFAAWPFLRTTLQDHLRRFPSTENGLGAIEWQALDHLLAGPRSFADLFAAISRQPYVQRSGLGDATLRAMLDASPLLVRNGDRYQLTPVGQRVVLGMEDAIRLHGIDRRLGGVHLTRANLWRWDEANARLTRSA